MRKWKNVRRLLGFIVLALAIFLPQDATASPFGNQLNLNIALYKNSDEDPIQVLEEVYDLDDVEDHRVIADFNDPALKAYGISGKIVYHKSSNTVDFQSFNNENSNAEMDLTMGVQRTKNFTCRFTGDNAIYGRLLFSSQAYDDTTVTLTGDGLRIKNHRFPTALDLIGRNLQIVDTNLQIQHEQTALSYYGGWRPAPLKIIHSTLDIQGESTNPEQQIGISGGPMEFSGSTLSVKEKGYSPVGLYMGEKIVFSDSKATIETEGKPLSIALCAEVSSTEVAAEINNSEVYLTAKGPNNADEEKNYEAYGIGGRASYESGLPKNYVRLSNSILEAQGDTGAVQGILEFSEALYDAYVKKDLKEDKQFYPVNTKDDKKNLGFLRGEEPTHKFVHLEPHLKNLRHRRRCPARRSTYL